MQTVPYTFDQGRDYLRTQSIVRDGDIAVFGPPAGGLDGLSHGVWWYYELIIPYLLGGAHPIAFSYFIFTVNAAAVILFALFLKKYFNAVTSLFFLAIIAGSPYFILSSFFPINSVMTIPFILLLYSSYYMLITKKKPVYIFLFALSAGFIFEAEVPFGLFLYPALLLTLLFTKSIRYIFASKKHVFALLAGLILPFFPRILAEIVSALRQSKALFSYFINPSEPVSKDANMFLERFKLFSDYFLSVFSDHQVILAWLFLALIFTGLYTARMQKNKHSGTFFWFSITLPISLFFLSLLSRKLHFWSNYFEGIQYMLIIPPLLSFYFLSISKRRIISFTALLILTVFISFPLRSAVTDAATHKAVPLDGLRKHMATLEAVYRAEINSSEICIRVYTPPVIPHTYNYLFSYFEKTGRPRVTDSFIDGACWFILEKDSCNFTKIEVAERVNCEARQGNWKKDQLPDGAVKVRDIPVSREVRIERWQVK